MNAHFQDDMVNALNWRKSHHCASDKCVEVALGASAVHVRDSANPEGPLLAYGMRNWRTFVRGLEHGQFAPLR